MGTQTGKSKVYINSQRQIEEWHKPFILQIVDTTLCTHPANDLCLRKINIQNPQFSEWWYPTGRSLWKKKNTLRSIGVAKRRLLGRGERSEICVNLEVHLSNSFPKDTYDSLEEVLSEVCSDIGTLGRKRQPSYMNGRAYSFFLSFFVICSPSCTILILFYACFTLFCLVQHVHSTAWSNKGASFCGWQRNCWCCYAG